MAASGEEGSVFDCPICLEKLRNPKYLPCLHTFCELCIQSFIESSISNCVIKQKTISFDCPVCRRVIPPPTNNISAKEWAEQLPKNHQLLAISESYQKQAVSGEVFCDSCRQNDEQAIATIRCQQCRDNLCTTCCKFIHERVKAFGLHTFADLRSSNAEIDNTVEPGNCLVHKDKPIEVYCFDHGELGCSYCMPTVHKECQTVLSLDEIDENALENSAESCINETQQMRDLTSLTILDTKKNMAELKQERKEILKNFTVKIEDIKKRLNYLHLKFRSSLNRIVEKETSDLSFVLKTLEDFEAILVQNENIASSVTQRGTKKQIFIAMEKIKLRLSNYLERIATEPNDFKRSTIKWNFIDVEKSLNELTELGDPETIIERFDFITLMKEHHKAMEEKGSLKEIAKENKHSDKKRGRKIAVPDSLCPSNISEIKESDPDLHTYSGVMDVSSALVVAAIEIGNTFSGYAFALRHDVEKNPLKIFVPQWCASDSCFVSSKTSTTVLLNNEQQLYDFGFDAESKYAELFLDEKHEDYFFFPHFKRMVYDHAKTKRLTSNTKIPDIRGRELPAVTVFACAISYLKGRVLEELERTDFRTLGRDDISWVITVPAIWDDNARTFMRNAAQKAGIPSTHTIALEPEAASIYCRYDKNLKSTNPIFQPRNKYLYLDAGGGSVDMTVLEVSKNGSFKELELASCGDWGGTSVDMAFRRALAEITTEEMIESYRQKNPDDYHDLFREFEMKKRSCRKGGSLHIPISFNEECLEILGTDLTTLINSSKYKDNFRMISYKLRINSFETFFQPACDGIITHVKKWLQNLELRNVNKILMAGGFSESSILQDAIRNAFPDCQVIIPEDASLAVLRGAVIFGFSSHPISSNSQVSRHTYGVDMDARFDPTIHKESKKEVIDGVEYCTGLFDKLLEKDEKVFPGKASALKLYIPLTPQQNFVSFCIYASTKKNPLYIEQCIRLGEIGIHVPVGLKNRILSVKIIFFTTELTVQATVLETGERVVAQINFLGD